MQKAQASTVVVILQRAVPVMLAIAVVTFALFGLQGAAVAAESGSIGSGATILTGKVVTTVTRAAPVPFHAVVDEVLVKPGQPVDKGAPLMRYHLQEEAERILQREVTTGAGTEDLKGQVLDLERRLAETELKLAKTRLDTASMQYKESQISFHEGIAQLPDMASKQEDMVQARIAYINAELDYKLAQLEWMDLSNSLAQRFLGLPAKELL